MSSAMTLSTEVSNMWEQPKFMIQMLITLYLLIVMRHTSHKQTAQGNKCMRPEENKRRDVKVRQGYLIVKKLFIQFDAVLPLSTPPTVNICSI